MPQIGELSVKIAADIKDLVADLAKATLLLQGFGKNMQKIGNQVGQAFTRVQKSVKDTSERIGKMGQRMRQSGEGMVDFAENTMQGITLPLALLGGLSIKAAGDIDRMFSILNAKVGGSASKMKELTPIVQQVFRDGLGKDLNEVAMIAGHAREKLSSLNTAQLTGVINNVAALSSILGIDAVGAIDEAALMMDKFKITSDQAMDLIAAGFTTTSLEGKNLSSVLAQVKGRAEEVTGIAKDDTWVRFSSMWRQVQAALKPVGDELAKLAFQYLPSVISAIQSFSGWFSSLSSGAKLAVVGFAALAAVLPIIALTLGALIMVGGAVAGAIGSIGTALAAVTAPVWGVIAAVVALGAIFIYAYHKFAWFRNALSTGWETVKAAIQTAFQAILAFIQPAVTAIVQFVLQQWNRIKTWWAENGTMIVQAAQNVWNFLKAVITSAMQGIWAIMQFIWPAIQMIITFVWESIKGVISGAIGVILSIIQIFAALFTGNWSALWEGVKSLVKNALILIWNLFNLMLVGRVLSIIKGFGMKAFSFLKSIWSKISASASSFLSRIANYFATKYYYIRSLTAKVWNSIKSYLLSVWNSIKSRISSAVSAVASRIKSGFNQAKNAVQNAANQVKSILSGLASKALSWGRNLGTMFANGLKSAIGKAVAAAKSAAAKIKSFLGWSSPTKEGPGRDSDQWAPNLMNMLASGIEAGIPKLQTSVTQAANVISNVQPTEGTMATTSSPTVNVYPQRANLNPAQLMRELQRASRLNGGRYI